MSSSISTLKFLYDLQRFGIKAGLENIRAILSFLGNPERQFPCIHIAGTNGKGSTAAMLAAVFTASGYKTGLYTSPHLIDFRERIRINGRMIPERQLTAYAASIQSIVHARRATFFEATTAIAFQYFADEKVDVAVIETGLGGRWDATNVITPVLSIITSIGLDHVEYLGNSIESIAKEKGGIIKEGVPIVCGVRDYGARTVLLKIADRKSAFFIDSRKQVAVRLKREKLSGLLVDIKTPQNTLDDLTISLTGDYQMDNVRVALSAIECLAQQSQFSKLTHASLRRGLSNISELTGFRGRIEVFTVNPLIIGDVAHNIDGIRALIRSLRKLLVGKCVTVFGVMNDKDASAMAEELSTISRLIIAVQPKTPRALPSSSLMQIFHRKGFPAIDGGTVGEGMARSCTERRENETILVVGSHYVLGEAMGTIGTRPE